MEKEKAVEVSAPEPREKKPMNEATGTSITGFVLGVTSVVLCWVPFIHFILVVLGIVFSSIAISRREKFGVAGLVLSIVGYLPFIFFILIAIAQTATYTY